MKKFKEKRIKKEKERENLPSESAAIDSIQMYGA